MTQPFPLAFSTLGCPAWTLQQAAAAAAAHGYSGLEIRLLDGEIIAAELPAARRRTIRTLMQEHGLAIVALGASTRFSDPDAAARAANAAELIRYLELANDLEAPMVRTFGGQIAPTATLDETIGWVADGLASVMRAAERLGVSVMLETHDAFCRGAEVAQVLARVPHDRLGTIWDVHHPYRMGEPIEETWRLIGSRVGHVHLKDAQRCTDGSWQLVLMGEGEVPNRAVIELLGQAGYRGWLCAEWEKKWHPEIEEPEIALPQHAAVLREWALAR